VTAYPPGDPNTVPPPQYYAYPVYPAQPRPYQPTWGPAPALWPVIAFSLVSWLFGLISVLRRTNRARQLGHPTGRYWGAFAGASIGGVALWAFVLVVLVAFTYHPVMSAPQLAHSIVQKGYSTDGSGTRVAATFADCVATDVERDGSGRYRCTVDFANGAHETFVVRVLHSGDWVTEE